MTGAQIILYTCIGCLCAEGLVVAAAALLVVAGGIERVEQKLGRRLL